MFVETAKIRVGSDVYSLVVKGHLESMSASAHSENSNKQQHVTSTVKSQMGGDTNDHLSTKKHTAKYDSQQTHQKDESETNPTNAKKNAAALEILLTAHENTPKERQWKGTYSAACK
jgi:hypothetical protein